MAKATFSPEDGLLSQLDFLQKISEVDFPIVVTNKKIRYYNVPAAFDIEVSSFMDGGRKCACMYIWQFGILNWVTYGRTWDEYKRFISVLHKILGLDDTTRLPVYIHNFGYEFQFMRKRFSWTKLFFLDERKPVYGITGGIEYRCSLKLSSKTLMKVGEDLQKYKYEKKMGDLDYSLIRTSVTPLTETELGYCEADIRVLLAYIQEKIETDGDVTRIPMTNTGYVRNLCRKKCFKKYRLYHGLMEELTIDPEEYSQLKRGFAGGFTHASAQHSCKIHSDVGSFDFISSYPAVMLAEKFPMSKGKLIKKIETVDEFINYLKRYCCLFDITLHNIEPKVDYDHPISYSKLINCKNEVLDNGRLVTAEYATLTCTEQDFFTYMKFYNWTDIDIHLFRIYEKGYLPKPFVSAILELYEKKTTLKDVEGEEINYMISKNMLNSAYGMIVTDIVRDEIKYENDEYSSTKPDLKGAIDHYNESKRRFLFYPWGVWVTAYSRRNLFSGILACGNDYIYSDTDSIKILNPEKHMDYINRYNELMAKKIQRAAEFHHIDPAKFSPLNQKGVAKPIGYWEYEGMYDSFKTLGAKRYMVKKNGKYAITVAGVNKSKARDYLVQNYKEPLDGLKDGMVIPSDWSGRLALTYSDVEASGEITDYLGNVGEYEELSYVHMEPTEYSLTISEEYKAFLGKLLDIKEDSW